MITVLGDVMVDEYWGLIDVGANPECTGGRKYTIPFGIDRRLGGAGVVARQLVAAGRLVRFASRVGGDPAGSWVAEECHRLHIGEDLVVQRPLRTTRKVRLSRMDDMLPHRIDLDDTSEPTPAIKAQLSNVALDECLVISDYGKGVCHRQVLQSIIRRANSVHIPVLVDPAAQSDWGDYAGATLIKCNLPEAIGQLDKSTSPRRMAVLLAEKHDVATVVTCGERGCGYSDRRGRDAGVVRGLPELGAVDVCGCGDTVLSVLALGAIWGWTLRESCQYAMLLGSQQTRHRGAYTLPDAFASLAAMQLNAIRG